MNVLWLNANLLLPLDKGGKLRTWHVMRQLARHHRITYLSFVDPAASPADLEGMHEVCAELDVVSRRDPEKGTFRFYVDAARHVVDHVPYAVGKYRSLEFRRRVRAHLDRGRFDLVVCDFLVPAVNLPPRLACPSVLFTHNVEADIWRRHADTTSNGLARTLLRQQWKRMLRFERSALERFDLVLTVSEADRDTFQRLYPGALQRRPHVVQTGVDTAFFTPPVHEPRRTHLVFTGSMDWLPNEDAMVWFVREILPQVRRLEPDTTLTIVGRAPTPAVRRLAETAGITVTGRVDDVRPLVAEAAVYVVPLRIGGGTRLKIFEAMSMGKAVVSTTIGAEGLPVTSDRDIVIADKPERFADSIVRLVRDDAARRSLEAAARSLVVEHYDWSVVAHDFDAALTAARSSPVGDELVTRPADSRARVA